VDTPFIAETDERNQEFRCQVVREQPFRSSTNDVSQATDRCNLDFQFLFCAPPLPQQDEEEMTEDPPERTVRRRLTKKTTLVVKKQRKHIPTWFPLGSRLSKAEQRCIRGFTDSFRKAAAMDFYITKYQGKPMELLTPLFKAMTDGIHRLENQEAQEKEAVQGDLEDPADADSVPQPVAKKRKTLEALQRRARRVTIRLASMANRCFWLSACELTVHILTDGDCLQSHNNMRIFTRQLQWAAQECKRFLNNEREDTQAQAEHVKVQAVSFNLKVAPEEQVLCFVFLFVN
jgi:hypothetical protein